MAVVWVETTMKPQQLTLGQRAQSTLRVRGWHKDGERITDGSAQPPLLPRCLLQVVTLHTIELGGRTARDYLKELGFQSFDEAIAWNDAPERTFEEVLELLERI
jgi:hypothetical protein